MILLQDFLSLIAGTITIFFLKERSAFSAILAGGLILSGLCWWLCSFYTHLWNKRYKVRLTHHLLCGLAAVITLGATVVFATLKHAASAADVSIEAWKVQLGMDQFWADQTFKQAYERVRSLGLRISATLHHLRSAIPFQLQRSRRRSNVLGSTRLRPPSISNSKDPIWGPLSVLAAKFPVTS